MNVPPEDEIYKITHKNSFTKSTHLVPVVSLSLVVSSM